MKFVVERDRRRIFVMIYCFWNFIDSSIKRFLRVIVKIFVLRNKLSVKGFREVIVLFFFFFIVKVDVVMFVVLVLVIIDVEVICIFMNV